MIAEHEISRTRRRGGLEVPVISKHPIQILATQHNILAGMAEHQVTAAGMSGWYFCGDQIQGGKNIISSEAGVAGKEPVQPSVIAQHDVVAVDGSRRRSASP